MTPLEARSVFWQAGSIAPWFLRPSQLDVYDLLQNEKNPFVEASRRFGKTTSIIVFTIEKLLQNPGWVCRWCSPEQKQARTIVKPIMDKLMVNAPKHLRFHYRTMDSVYIGPNNQLIYLVGVNDNAESARGPASNIIVADEFGTWKDPDYVVKDILSPQLQGQEGQWFIKASTPPRDLDHVYYTEKESAIRRGRFIKKTIYDNEAVTKDELDKILEDCGGAESTTFRREYLCEEVSDAHSLVIPEWSDELNIVEDDYPRPQFFDAYMGGDSGADDNTALLFAYYDFMKEEVVIEAEFVKNGQTSGEIVTEAKKIEKALWGSQEPFRRVYDADKQLIFDLIGDHNYPVTLPRKADRISSIHELRLRIGARKIKVKRACVNTCRQLKVGMWKDDKHSDFTRTDSLGHLDAVAACLYLNRSIDTSHNPIPPHSGLSVFTNFLPDSQGLQGANEQAFKAAFNRTSRSR
jgi:hypothetical protein